MCSVNHRPRNFTADKQQWHRPACASAQNDQRNYNSLSQMNSSPTCSVQNVNVLTSICTEQAGLSYT